MEVQIKLSPFFLQDEEKFDDRSILNLRHFYVLMNVTLKTFLDPVSVLEEAPIHQKQFGKKTKIKTNFITVLISSF